MRLIGSGSGDAVVWFALVESDVEVRRKRESSEARAGVANAFSTVTPNQGMRVLHAKREVHREYRRLQEGTHVTQAHSAYRKIARILSRGACISKTILSRALDRSLGLVPGPFVMQVNAGNTQIAMAVSRGPRTSPVRRNMHTRPAAEPAADKNRARCLGNHCSRACEVAGFARHIRQAGSLP